MRVILRVILGLMVVVVLGLSTVALAPPIQTAIAIHQLGSSDAAVRKRALVYIRDERDAAAESAVLDRLAKETAPVMVDLVGYTLMKTRDPRGLPALKERADRETDPVLKAKLIYESARLAERDYRSMPWLDKYARSAEPWPRAAACVGLLLLGRLEGGDLLVQIQASLPSEPRDFALQELRRVLEPMGETVGAPLNWPDETSPRWQDVAWTRMSKLWSRIATQNLLGDVLTRLDRNDSQWRDVERVLHGRWYASKWIH